MTTQSTPKSLVAHGGPPLTVAEIRDRGTISVEEWARLFGVSRAYGYELARRGDLPTIRVGKRIRVPVAPLLKMLGAD